MLGRMGIAFSTITIAIYTFLGVWVTKEIKSMKLTLGLILAVWLFIALLVVVALRENHANQNFIRPSPYFCTVHTDDVRLNSWMVLLGYLWEWLGLIISFLLYIPLYLWMRGNLIIDESAWWRFHFKFSMDKNPENCARRRKSLAMLAYPAVYCMVVPLDAVRWAKFVQPGSTIGNVPFFTPWIFGHHFAFENETYVWLIWPFDVFYSCQATFVPRA